MAPDDTDYLQDLIDRRIPIPIGRYRTTRTLVVPRDFAGFVVRPAGGALDHDAGEVLGSPVLNEGPLAATAEVEEPRMDSDQRDARAIGHEDRSSRRIGLGDNPQLESHEGSSRKAPPAGPPGADPGSYPEPGSIVGQDREEAP
jgi:hypothetical protein